MAIQPDAVAWIGVLGPSGLFETVPVLRQKVRHGIFFQHISCWIDRFDDLRICVKEYRDNEVCNRIFTISCETPRVTIYTASMEPIMWFVARATRAQAEKDVRALRSEMDSLAQAA